ncbi:MAG: hypothetical protein NVSMB34_07390 [Variovorax sp.]
MPYSLLIRLSQGPLPTLVDNLGDIHKVRALHTVGMLEAEIPGVVQSGGHLQYVGAAKVLRLTQQGFEVTKKSSGSSGSVDRAGAPVPERVIN